ncbi:MAG: hypothetical protein K2X57_01615 [Xanthobacteraceae bacterium]|nr:hypothetical protein [Xanthobacteraceae bacterium]
MVSADIGRLSRTSVVGSWVRAVASRFKRPAQLKNTNRAEFEQIARDLDLSPPQLYGLLTGRALSADAVEKRLSDIEIDSEQAGTLGIVPQEPRKPHLTAEMREFLMFGPFCC